MDDAELLVAYARARNLLRDSLKTMTVGEFAERFDALARLSGEEFAEGAAKTAFEDRLIRPGDFENVLEDTQIIAEQSSD